MQPGTDIPPTEHRWLRRFSYLVIVATFILIAIGGKVTSFEFGMAIPDGVFTGGWISLFAPLKYWFHDTDKFWEHTHRIKGSIVGMLTVAMTVWLWITQRHRPWLRWMGVAMLLMVCFQGYLGATRVDLNSLAVAFVHGIGGQMILCGWIVVAAALSKPWLSRINPIKRAKRAYANSPLRWAVRVLLVLLLVQLTLGSAVRHFKADKAIPDFPLVYGQFIPPMSQDALDTQYALYYAGQIDQTPEEAGISNRTPQGKIVVTLASVYLQFAHRLGAYVVCIFSFYVIIKALSVAGDRRIVVGPVFTLLMLLIIQFALGISTVMTQTDPVMATLHQATGAVLIAAATWLAVRIHLAEYAAEPVTADNSINASTQSSTSPMPATPATP